ncbi:MAG: glycosyltransferase family 4 protein, partial [Chloroflexales bacterium]|nr:glycosyltransferase family 4 protein [Chloroflexales bacterium]
MLKIEHSQRSGRVCHLTSVHPHNDIRIFIKECGTLAAAGFETHLVAPGAPHGIHDGVFLHGIAGFEHNRLTRMTRSVRAVYQQALAIDADIYHFHDPELIPVGLLLKRRGKEVIYDIHEDVPRQILQKTYLPRRSRRLIGSIVERLENSAARRFSALVAATPVIGARFAPLNPHTVVINNYPLRNELLPSATTLWSGRLSRVAYVGSLTADRGMFQMVEAMTLVSPRMRATLELAGTIG